MSPNKNKPNKMLIPAWESSTTLWKMKDYEYKSVYVTLNCSACVVGCQGYYPAEDACLMSVYFGLWFEGHSWELDALVARCYVRPGIN